MRAALNPETPCCYFCAGTGPLGLRAVKAQLERAYHASPLEGRQALRVALTAADQAGSKLEEAVTICQLLVSFSFPCRLGARL